jgi:polyphosphate kinase
VSENVCVTSIVGRFLEHSRIFYFRNGGEDEVYLGSADMMTRNLDRRVEVVFPIQDAKLVQYLRDTVLATYPKDVVKARTMQADGTYSRPANRSGANAINSQEWFLKNSGEMSSEKKRSRPNNHRRLSRSPKPQA